MSENDETFKDEKFKKVGRMARSNGHNGQAPPQGHPGDAVPHWRHPSDPGPHAHGQPAFPPFATPAHTQSHYPASPDLPPYGQQPGDPHAGAFAPPFAQPVPHQQTGHQQPGAWPQPVQHEPQRYDFGQFGHGAAPGHAPAQDPYARPASPPMNPQTWAPQQPYTHPPHHTGLQHDPHQLPSPASFAEPSRGHHPYPVAAPAAVGVAAAPALAATYAQRSAAQQNHPAHQPAEEPYAEEDYDDEDPLDEEPRRGRKLMVVGALVGAICVGGGLAFAYKTFSGGRSPMLASSKQAPKVAAAPVTPPPAKVAAKLPDAIPAPAVASVATTDEGPRRVQTIAVVPPGSSATPPQPTPPPSAAVMPGMVLDNLPRAAAAPPPNPAPVAPLRPSAPPVAPPPQQQASAPVAKAPVAVPPPVQPKVTNATIPEKAPAAERKVAAAPVPKVAKTGDAFNPKAVAGTTGGFATVVAATAPATGKAALGANSGANGYVAVLLSTQKGRPDAMKAFADLQQKFPDVLGGKPAEVQEKDLGAEKGVWYRAVVGPPASRSAASEVCTQLKASGYGQCFVTAY